MKNRFDFITRTSKKLSASWSNIEKARFHAYNPNGLVAEFNSLVDVAFDYIDNGVLNSGFLSGVASTYSSDEMSDLATKKQVNTITLEVRVEMLEARIFKIKKAFKKLEPTEAKQVSTPKEKIGQIQIRMLHEGNHTPEEIVNAVLHIHPNAKTNVACVKWYIAKIKSGKYPK